MDASASAIREGEPAPSFRLPSGDGREIGLADLRGKRVVLYFYPKDDTPGCTREACAFRDLRAEFAAKDAEIIGVSLDDATSHQAFSQKYGLSFPLLSDEQAEVSKRYGVYVLKQRDGREFWGIDRTTFIIDRQGIVRKVFPKVTVDGHAEELLAALDALDE
jgi:peroxiredoxin Q/BCP